MEGGSAKVNRCIKPCLTGLGLFFLPSPIFALRLNCGFPSFKRPAGAM